MPFEHDSLIAHVRSVNARKESHGEDDVTACDVSVRLLQDDAGTGWDAVLADLMNHTENAAENAVSLGQLFTKLPFAAAWDEHKVNFRQGNALLGSLIHAKINKFVMDFDDIGITFRIQAEADGATIGKLCELIKQKVRLEIVALQGALDLEESEEETEEEPA